ncbi:MAG: hypothetical protein J7J91_00745, partial [Deltaproteobacteria bacterium]|nr:hypothetical protein [Deltaproteobacteria bacterium]
PVHVIVPSRRCSFFTLGYLPAGRQVFEFEAVYTGLPVCSLCLFFETAKLIRFLKILLRIGLSVPCVCFLKELKC